MKGYSEERNDGGKGVYRHRVDAGTDPLTGKRRLRTSASCDPVRIPHVRAV
jgi:hypothetical protein